MRSRNSQQTQQRRSPTTTSSLLLALLLPLSVSAQSPFRIPYDTKKSFGYDGPWNAVKINVGNQDIHLYPGRFGASLLPGESVCDSYKNSICPTASDYYDFAKSTEYNQDFHMNLSMKFKEDVNTIQGVSWTSRNAIDTVVLSGTGSETFKSANSSLKVATKGSVTFPGGLVAPPDLGWMSLGASDADIHVWNGNDNWQSMSPINWMETNKVISSRTWVMHIGSALLGIEGSLVFGGYDQARVVEKPTTYDVTDMSTDIIGINIGVAEGGLPSESLKTGSKFAGKTSVKIMPTLPYMYLPTEICDAFAESLPITFDSDLGLYLWDTKDPAYKAIIDSPAYVAFNFPSVGTNVNTIKIPLKLLDLRLDKPVRDTPTPYFPCRPVPKGADVILGRAFLQAAVIGMNWKQKKFWLGQAPGPGVGVSVIKSLAKDAVDLEAIESNDWKTSWKETWKVTAGDNKKVGNVETVQEVEKKEKEEEAKKSGIPTGAIIGIVVAVVFCVLGAVGIVAWLWSRKRSKATAPDTSAELLRADPDVYQELAGSERQTVVPSLKHEMYQPSSPYKQSPRGSVVELAGMYPAAELRGDAPVELSAEREDRRLK